MKFAQTAALLGCLQAVCSAAPLPLIGSSGPVPITTSASPSTVERFAAQELARYLSRITGQAFAVAAGPVRGLAIAVETSARIAGEEAFEMRREGNRIQLSGGGDRGTLYAVYAFLEHLGCRWFAPSFDFYAPVGGELVPHVAAPTVDQFDVREAPAMRWRKKYVEEGQSHTAANLKQLVDWMAKARLNVLDCPIDYQHHGRTRWDNFRAELTPELRKRGILIEVGGHGYPNFLPVERYFDQHPEWFGMKAGKRVRDPDMVFSTANPDAVRTFITNVKTYLRTHPEIDIFDCWPPDAAKWSDAPEDVALGSPNERQILLLNQVTKELAPEFPQLKVQFIAYASYLQPPKVNHPAGAVVMDFCPIDRSFETRLDDSSSSVNASYFADLQGWLNGIVEPQSVTMYSYVTKYAWRSLPVLIPHLIVEELRKFHSLNLGGYATYSEPACWATFELDHYIAARATWNPAFDVDRELKDYTSKRYGTAGAPVLQYLKLVEETVPHAVGIPGTTLELTKQREMTERFASAAALLEQAREAAGANPGLLVLLDKLQQSRRYAANEMKLRLIMLQSFRGWGTTLAPTLEKLLAERREIMRANASSGVILTKP